MSTPASRPRPIVCTARIMGNANNEGDSRIHTLNEVASSQRKNGSSTAAMLSRHGGNEKVLEPDVRLGTLSSPFQHTRERQRRAFVIRSVRFARFDC